MTLRLTLLAVPLLFAIPSARAADPTPDELIAKLTDLRKQAAELAKQDAALVAELRAKFADLQERLAKLGVVGPGPIPPAPEPKPVDALKAKLRAAFEADKGTRDDALQLAELYRQAAKLAADPGVPTTAELVRRVREAGAAVVGQDVLKGVRAVVRDELTAVLGKVDSQPITPAERDAAAAIFTKLANILGGF